MTITEFLLARIAEDEAVAREIDEAAWSYDVAANREAWADRDRVSVGVGRVLAECEAKRRIVEREEAEMRTRWRQRSDEHRQTWEQWLSSKGRGEMLTLRDLASIYADHPDFDEEWRV